MERVMERYLQPLVKTGWGYWVPVSGLVLLIAWALFAYIRQLWIGLEVTGMNTPTYWGFYIVNFVFFIGLSAGGIIVASLVHAFGIERFRSVARLAELMSISCLILATIFITLDLGRPDRLYHLLIYPRFESPLVWDVIVIVLYLLVGMVYGYFGTRADLVRCMDSLPQRRWLLRVLALGYTDLSESALGRDRRILKVFAVIGLPLAVALHSITAWILGLLKARPGWHSALLAPLFVVSATVSGLALLTASAVFSKRFLNLDIKEEVIKDLGKLLAFLIPVLGYFLFAELLTATYGKEPAGLHIFREMIFGSYAFVFWGNLVGGLVIPLLILANPRTRTELGIGLSSILVVLGVLAERWNIVIIPLLGHANLPYAPGSYTPTWVEMSLTVGVYAIGALFFALCVKIIPLVEMEKA